MIKFIDVTGKTEDEAIQSALAQLKMDRDDVSVEILERAKAGFLGIGSAPARVRVSYDDGKAEEVKPVEKPAMGWLKLYKNNCTSAHRGATIYWD
jgi:spoIIIJ-associated protein